MLQRHGYWDKCDPVWAGNGQLIQQVVVANVIHPVGIVANKGLTGIVGK